MSESSGGRTRWVFLLMLAAMVMIAVAGCGSGGDEATGPSTTGDGPNATAQGNPGADAAPGFSGATLDGRSVDLGAFNGKPLVLAFTASW